VQTRALLDQLTMLLFPVGQAYLWRDADGITLVDTGMVGSAQAIEQAVRTLGCAPSDVDRVVITHFHDDHAGGAAEVGSWPGVTILAHRCDAPVIRGETPGPPPDFTDEERALHASITAGGVLPPAPPARVDRELEDGDVLDFGGGAHVLGVPGHTDGSLALFLPAHGVLFTGDVVASHQGQVLLGPFNLDRRTASASFRRLAALDSRMALFGHGEPVTRNARAALSAAVPALPH
jgi:glyoxylase-like metal-dependent hydrolase (beta-lactamase superfamily II)